MQNLKVIEVKGQRVLTTKQIAEAYGTEPERIKLNYRYNKSRFIPEKHIISIEGNELREFKARYQFDTQFKYAKSLYLWTEKGALLHAKSLNTDKAWEVYDYLVDFYFRAQEEVTHSAPVKKEIIPVQQMIEPMKEKESQDAISIFKTLLKIAERKGIVIKTKEISGFKSYLKGDRIAVRNGLSLEEVNFEIAFELYHAMVNFDHGDMVTSPLAKYYNKQAERAAAMIIQLLTVNIKTA